MTLLAIARPLAAAAAVLALVACDKPAETAPPLPPVRLAQPVPTDPAATETLAATGLVRLREEVPMAFKIGGVIRQMAVEAGQSVRAGQVLASLDPAEIDAQVLTARENVLRAERDLDRARTLQARGMVTQRAEQDARTARDQAKAALDAAEFNRSHAVIVAPAAGVVLQKHAEARETVAAGQPVLVVGRFDRGWVVKSGMSARDAVRLAVGDRGEVTLDATGARLGGQISRIAAASDPRTGTVEVETALPRDVRGLVSGMVAHVNFKTQARPSGGSTPALRLPLSAVLEGDGDKAHVFVVDGGKVRRVDIGIGPLRGDSVEVTGGLAADAQVVVEGAAWLSDGDAVRVLR